MSQDVRVAASSTDEVVVRRHLALRVLLVTVVGLNLANAVSIALGADTEATRYFLLTSERNPSTWFSAALLAATALLAIAVGRGRHDATRWNLVGGVLLLLSLDEIATFHERMSSIPLIPGVGSRGWAGAGLVLAAVVGARLVGWVRNLERPLRSALLTGGALFVGGAVGLEVLAGDHRVVHGTDGTYWLLSTAEENLEMLGPLLVARALLGHLAAVGQRLTVRVRD